MLNFAPFRQPYIFILPNSELWHYVSVNCKPDHPPGKPPRNFSNSLPPPPPPPPALRKRETPTPEADESR